MRRVGIQLRRLPRRRHLQRVPPLRIIEGRGVREPGHQEKSCQRVRILTIISAAYCLKYTGSNRRGPVRAVRLTTQAAVDTERSYSVFAVFTASTNLTARRSVVGKASVRAERATPSNHAPLSYSAIRSNSPFDVTSSSRLPPRTRA